jgi:recombinational DNA repair protein RecR
MAESGLSAELFRERSVLAERVAAQRDQVDRLQQIAATMEERLSHDEHLLSELDGLLGIAAQLRIETLDERLRGQRLEEIAIAVLRDECGSDAIVHYRDWFKLVRARGHRIAGKNPLGTFLAQINRSTAVERVGRRTGRYRLATAHA